MHFAFSASDEQTGRNSITSCLVLSDASLCPLQAEQTGSSWLQSTKLPMQLSSKDRSNGEMRPHIDCERHHSCLGRFFPPPAFPALPCFAVSPKTGACYGFRRSPHLPPHCRRSGCLDFHFPHICFRTYSQTERLCRVDGRRPESPRPPPAGLVSPQDRPGPAGNGETQPRCARPAARRERHLHHGLLSSFDRASAGCAHPQVR